MPSSWWIRIPAAAVSLLDCPCRYRALSKAVGLSGGGDRCGDGGGAGGRGRGLGGETDSCSGGGGGLGEPRSSPLETPCGTGRGMCGDDGCRGLTTNADGGGDADGCELRRSSTAKEHRATKTSKTSLPVRDSAKAFNEPMGELRARANASWTARLRERRRRCSEPRRRGRRGLRPPARRRRPRAAIVPFARRAAPTQSRRSATSHSVPAGRQRESRPRSHRGMRWL